MRALIKLPVANVACGPPANNGTRRQPVFTAFIPLRILYFPEAVEYIVIEAESLTDSFSTRNVSFWCISKYARFYFLFYFVIMLTASRISPASLHFYQKD
jgi:hypothetical protein